MNGGKIGFISEMDLDRNDENSSSSVKARDRRSINRYPYSVSSIITGNTASSQTISDHNATLIVFPRYPRDEIPRYEFQYLFGVYKLSCIGPVNVHRIEYSCVNYAPIAFPPDHVK